jgi:hypothetical protein
MKNKNKKPKEIQIEYSIPTRTKNKLNFLFGRTIQCAYLGGNHQVMTTHYSPNLEYTFYTSNEVSFILSDSDNLLEISLSTSIAENHDHGQFDRLHLNVFAHPNDHTFSKKIMERMLVKNRWLMRVGLDNNISVDGIELFGTQLANVEFEDNLSLDTFLYNIELPRLLNIQTNAAFLLSCHCLDGQLRLNIFQRKEFFRSYIDKTNNLEDRLHQYSFLEKFA